MIKNAWEWLQKYWWGLIVAYFIVLVASYFAIWGIIEPLNIPGKIENFPSFVNSRVFLHLTIALIVAAYITLALDIWLRRNQWANMSANSEVISAESLERQLILNKHQQLLKVIRRIAYLQENYSVDQWKIIYSIDEAGNDFLYEELTIIPSHDVRYFYYKGYSVPENSSPDYSMYVYAKNLVDGTSLVPIEVTRSNEKIRYAIFLDPPSYPDQPKTIAIECRRNGLWKELIETQRCHGTLHATHNTNDLNIEFIAPRGRKWKAFHPAPPIGDYKIDLSSGGSRIIWHIPNTPPRHLGYEMFLEPI